MAGGTLQYGPPSTPKKQKRDLQELRQQIYELNDEYGLEILPPDPGESPRKQQERKKEKPEAASQIIWRRLHIQFCNKDRDAFQGILDSFRQRAFSVSLLDSTGLKKQKLERILLKILEELSPPIPTLPILGPPAVAHPPTPKKRPFSRVKSGPAEFPVQGNNRAFDQKVERHVVKCPNLQNKRYSDDWSSDSASTKRARGQHSTTERPRSAESVLDSVPVISTLEQSEQSSANPLYSFRSASTSKTSFGSGSFSGLEERSRATSQSTLEGDCQELKPDRGLRQLSQDMFPASSGHLQALDESFSLHDLRAISAYRSPSRPIPMTTLYPSLSSSGVERIGHQTTNSQLIDNNPGTFNTEKLAVRSKPSSAETIQARLRSIWPSVPLGLEAAPLPILWEVTRIALYCEVDLRGQSLNHLNNIQGQEELRRALRLEPSFRGKPFPVESCEHAWKAGFCDFMSSGQAVVFSGTLEWNCEKTGPMFCLRLDPLHLDYSYRLSRRFGPDRFLELICPSLHASTPPHLKDNSKLVDEVINWLVREPHWVAGRQWSPFYLKDAGYRKPVKDVKFFEEPKPVVTDRIYFFAEDGVTFEMPSQATMAPIDDCVEIIARSKMKVSNMLEWALELTRNTAQPCLKLFQRIALVLSKTRPTVVFRHDQIHHLSNDILSPTNMVMNDGAARMSRSVALKIREILGLSDIPCAVQGRIGSAKGMWVIDVTDKSDDLWIETYPAQRKWLCSGAEDEHRTLEIRSFPRDPRSAHFNLQLLPVLQDRARHKEQFLQDVGGLLRSCLQEDLDSMKNAIRSPLLFRQWIHENSSRRQERVERGQVPYLGGLPDSDEEMIIAFLDAGFHPLHQKTLLTVASRTQERKCDELQKRLRIRIELSANVYMLPDFSGQLGKDEVHISFSTKFQGGGFSDTILHDVDLLVARNPAHYNSDVQKVRARFIPSLHPLKDVIIFSIRGNRPLADLLSGGDYDGDMAWICWDPRIVHNFENAPAPVCPDLFEMGFLRKDTETVADLIKRHGSPFATTEMLVKSFHFNMRGSLLGVCTNYKERLCYNRNNINDHHAVVLSTLVSHLVDQAKQGIDFTMKDFNRLCQGYLQEKRELPDPYYKSCKEWNWTSGQPRHIIDFLKFGIAKPAIDKELRALNQALNGKSADANQKDLGAEEKPKSRSGDLEAAKRKAEFWDPDLTAFYDNFAKFQGASRLNKELLISLRRDVESVKDMWDKTVGRRKANDGPKYREKVSVVYQEWRNIQPDKDLQERFPNSKTIAMLQPSKIDPNLNQWALLKASLTFKLFYNQNNKFVWSMAGKQLLHIKGLTIGGAMTVDPKLYAALMPSAKMMKQIVARKEGHSTVYDDDEDIDEDDE